MFSTESDTIVPLTIQADPVPLAPDETGTIRVANTRVTLDTIIEQFRAGATAEALTERFPVLTPADVHAVLAYYLRGTGTRSMATCQHRPGRPRRCWQDWPATTSLGPP